MVRTKTHRVRRSLMGFCLLTLLTISGAALNDIGLTIENSNTGLCISGSDLSDQTCNTTDTLILDGSADHMLYFTYELPYEGNATAIESGLFLVEHSLSYILAFGSGLFMLAIIFGGMIVFKKVFIG